MLVALMRACFSEPKGFMACKSVAMAHSAAVLAGTAYVDR